MKKISNARAMVKGTDRWAIGQPITAKDSSGKERTFFVLDDAEVLSSNCNEEIIKDFVEIESNSLGYETNKKDKNGNMIFEGMWLKYEDEHSVNYGIVKYDEEYFCYSFYGENLGLVESDKIEIIC